MHGDTTGANKIHVYAASLMDDYGDGLLAETVDDVANTHVADEAKRNCEGCGEHWPCYPWIASNDRVVRWLIAQVSNGEA